MRRLIFVGLLAFAVALVGTAYAEVQSVKVGGDIDIKAFAHHDYDLQRTQRNDPGTKGVTANTFDDDANLILSTVRVKVDADLTDNVSTSVRLLNQRFWDTDLDTGLGSTNDVVIDNAYVVLKEFLYSPLTVMVGRQDLKYGTGFIVGPGLLNDPSGVFSGGAVDVNGAGTEQTQIAQEYSAHNGYDALRVILDYAPITVEGLYSKINETGVASGDTDQTLYGALVNYKFDQWNAEVEPYWFYKHDDDSASPLTVSDAYDSALAVRTYETNRVHTVGLRVAGSPVENLQLNGEGAFQTGDMFDSSTQQGAPGGDRDRHSWGATVDARYTWAQVPWTPATGIGWVFFQGEETSGVNAVGSDKYNAWDAMYRGSFTTYIQDFFAGNDGGGLYVTRESSDTSAATNRHLLYFDVGASPLEDVNLWLRYTHALFDNAPRPGRSTNAGNEVDGKITYDYTEDVQLNLFGGVFLPGTFYDQQPVNPETGRFLANDTAWTFGGGGSVKF